jgi:hypothetical protein
VKKTTKTENRKETKSILASGIEAVKTLYSLPFCGDPIFARFVSGNLGMVSLNNPPASVNVSLQNPGCQPWWA